MDTFFEQIVKVKRTPKEIAGVVGIWLLALILLVVDFLFIIPSVFQMIGMLGILGILWGAYKLTTLSSIEYEYIFTNGDFDVDKIIAKASRKRMVSINCAKVERFGKYTAAVRPSGSVKKTYFFCDANAADAVYLIAPTRNEGNVMIVFAPDERVCTAIEKAIPRIAK